MTVNRKIAPEFNKLTNLELPLAEKHKLNCDIDLFIVNSGVEPIVKIDVVFNGGLNQQLYKAEAIFTASMLSEGTEKRSGKELTEALDFFGSYFQVKCNADDSVASLYCLTKHVKNCLPLFFEALFLSVMPQKELQVIKDNAIQKLRVNLKKNSFVARTRFYEKVYGIKHPYSVNHTEEDIKNIDRDNLISFFNNNYKNGIKYLFASGLINNEVVSQIEQEFKNWGFVKYSSAKNTNLDTNYGKFFFEKKDSLQCAIKIGSPSINRKNSDFTKLQIFNLMFGGYFGSRLMKVVREEKGLTYGIYSLLESFLQSGCWSVSTDLNNELKQQGIEAIYKEIENVKINGFRDDEIESGKQYFLGSILRGIDGAFSIAERNKILIDYELDNNYYNNLVNTINNITNNELIDVANKHIPEELIEVVVGS
ncbi:MAG: M16 family metallopeptidase [Bacteroidia bacterium]